MRYKRNSRPSRGRLMTITLNRRAESGPLTPQAPPEGGGERRPPIPAFACDNHQTGHPRIVLMAGHRHSQPRPTVSRRLRSTRARNRALWAT